MPGGGNIKTRFVWKKVVRRGGEEVNGEADKKNPKILVKSSIKILRFL